MIYVGKLPTGEREVFLADEEPSLFTHDAGYVELLGPFETWEELQWLSVVVGSRGGQFVLRTNFEEH